MNNTTKMLAELRSRWMRTESEQSTIQRRIWDRRAEDFSAHPLPDMDRDPFLQQMAAELVLDQNSRTLDVGCGAGGYSIALANRVGEAVGVDISPNMIRAAKDRAATLRLTNCRFFEEDWVKTDIDASGYRGAFDVVFAHMTPAVRDFTTLDKLNACSRNLCMLEKPTRRTSRIHDACFAVVGLPGELSLDIDLVNIFTYAWLKGYKPQLFYMEDTWRASKNVDDMIAWCTDMVSLKKKLAQTEKQAIQTLILKQVDENGLVEEVTRTTRVTVLWHV